MTRSGNNGRAPERACRDSRAGWTGILSWGQAPALHFLLPLSAVNSWFGKFRVLGGAYPGSESGTGFRTDAEDDTFSIDCDGGQERLGEASGFAFARKP